MFQSKKEKYAYVQGLKAGTKGKRPYGRKKAWKSPKKAMTQKKPAKKGWSQADAERLGNDLIEAWEEAGCISKAEADLYLRRK